MFITFEGGEGAGKSTIAKRLRHYLENKGYEVILTREPGGTEFADRVRDLIMKENISAYEEMMLFNVARLNHLKQVILPALANNKIVLCDRFIDSSRAYQGILGDCTYNEYQRLEQVNETIANSVDLIDTTFYFKIDPEIALNRITKNNRETNRFDKKDLDYHYQLQTAYEQLISVDRSNRFVVIDAEQDEEQVLQQCIDHLNL